MKYNISVTFINGEYREYDSMLEEENAQELGLLVTEVLGSDKNGYIQIPVLDSFTGKTHTSFIRLAQVQEFTFIEVEDAEREEDLS